MQQRGAYGPLTLLPHKTRVRHKKQAQVQNIQQNKFNKSPGKAGSGASRVVGGPGGPGRSRGSRVPGFQGGCRGGAENPEALQPAAKHEKLDKRSEPWPKAAFQRQGGSG